MTAPAAPAAGTTYPAWDIARGSRLAITLKNGRRIAGTALGRIRTTRAGESYLTVSYIGRKGTERVYTVDVVDFISLG